MEVHAYLAVCLLHGHYCPFKNRDEGVEIVMDRLIIIIIIIIIKLFI